MSTPLITPRQATVVGPLLVVVGAGLGVAAAVALAQHDAFGLLIAPVAAMVVGGGVTLGSRRGGVWLHPQGVALGGDSARSSLYAPFVDGARVVRRAVEENDGAVVRHSVELERGSGLCVLLAESDHAELLSPIADAVHEALSAQGWPPLPHAPALADTTVIRVGARSRLSGALLASGAALALTSVALLVGDSGAATQSFVAVPLLTLGVILLSIVGIKAFAAEVLVVEGPGWSHGWRLGPLRWFEFSGTADPAGGVRLRQRGLHGATLELIGQGRVHLLAGGVQERTPMSPAALLALGDALARWHAAQVAALPPAPVER